MKLLRLLLLWFTAFSALAGLNEQSVYVVGVEDVRYSPHYDHDGDEFLGVARDFLDEFAVSNAIRFEYRVLPVNRLYRELLESHSIDFKYPDDPHWAEAAKTHIQVAYSEPCFEYIDGVMVLPKNRGKPLASLGSVLGFTPVAYLPSIKNKSIFYEENPTAAGLLRQALMGRVDGAYINVDVAHYYLRQVLRQPYTLVWDTSKPFEVNSYKLSTVRHPQIIVKLNKFLVDHKAWLEDLKERYHVNDAMDALRSEKK